MASTYSTNLKIELQATGENSGTWGTITNTNLGTALEQAIVGYGNPNFATDANLTLTYTDTNAAQAARALVLNVTSTGSLSTTRELIVPTIQKQYIVQNNTTGSQSITVKTSAGTGITVPNARKAHLYVDGTNVIYMDDYVDINGGAIDGTTIGANSAAAGTFTTVDATNVEVTNVKAKDGTAAITIADSTGLVTAGAGVTLSGGNLTFSSTAQRITGDFSNATIANRLAFQNSVTNTQTAVVALPNGTSTQSQFMAFGANDGVNTNVGVLINTGSEVGIRSNITGTGTYVPLTFNTGGSERVRIDTSGQVGIGATPSAWTATFKALQVSSSSLYNNGANATFVGSNYFFDGTNNKYINSAAAAAYAQNGGEHIWYNAASGTAGNNVTFTERMRIDSSGNVGIGNTNLTQFNFRLSKNITGNASSQAIRADGTIQSDVTTEAVYVQARPSTVAASFTLTDLAAFAVSQGTFGASSAVTNQYGFRVDSALTGATNNYGFYGNIASGSNRYNVYMAGTADNYFAGNVGIGTASPSSFGKFAVQGASSTRVFYADSAAQPVARYDDNSFISNGFTIRNTGLTGTNQGIGLLFQLGASGTAVNSGAIQMRSEQDFSSAANQDAAMTFNTVDGGTMLERMRIDSSGNVGIGGTASASAKLHILGTLPTSSNLTVGSYNTGTIPSGTTSDAFSFWSAPATAAASFTLTSFAHYFASGITIGSGSTVTNQYGFNVQSTLTGATNNYGFYSNIASGSNRWNFYAAGTAQNYFAGNTGVGVAPAAAFRLQVSAATNISVGIANATAVAGAVTFNAVNDANSANIPLDFRSSATYFSAGIGTTASAANAYIDNATSNQLLRSTSSLRYKRDIVDYGRGLTELLGLRPVSFKGTSTSDGEKVFAGLIAEEVHDAGMTEFVVYNKEGQPDALHYGNMVALLVKAVQELTARVAELEAK